MRRTKRKGRKVHADHGALRKVGRPEKKALPQRKRTIKVRSVHGGKTKDFFLMDSSLQPFFSIMGWPLYVLPNLPSSRDLFKIPQLQLMCLRSYNIPIVTEYSESNPVQKLFMHRDLLLRGHSFFYSCIPSLRLKQGWAGRNR